MSKITKVITLIIIVLIVGIGIYLGTEKLYNYRQKPYEDKIVDKAMSKFKRLESIGDTEAIQKTINWLKKQDHITNAYLAGESLQIDFDSLPNGVGFQVISYENEDVNNNSDKGSSDDKKSSNKYPLMQLSEKDIFIMAVENDTMHSATEKSNEEWINRIKQYLDAGWWPYENKKENIEYLESKNYKKPAIYWKNSYEVIVKLHDIYQKKYFNKN